MTQALTAEQVQQMQELLRQRRREHGVAEDGNALSPVTRRAALPAGMRQAGELLKEQMKAELAEAQRELAAAEPADAVVYECAVCRDDPSGFVMRLENGKRVAARCECWKARRAKSLLRMAGLPEEFRGTTLENYLCAGNGSLEMARMSAGRYVQEWPKLERPGLLFWGPTGGGKTHLAAALLRMLIEHKGARALFRSYSALLQQLQGTFTSVSGQIEDDDGNAATAYDLVSDICEADVLVIDDIGPEKLTDWNRSMLYYVIDQRYSHRRSTIVTTNLPWDTAAMPQSAAQRAMRVESLRERVGERVHSRLEGMCRIVEVRGAKDWRRRA
ncbi:MAG TPA: ATP-binding protein [Candidatus Angelobacter sp.]|nr:ATP-binding protein [Candidatus Angelobacter sp.]